jgi:ATP/maltotriose-dependent transcriptional regulator MalT
MTEQLQQTSSVTNRHIIERPRLTGLLDDSAASVIMLVAPAGYGKTTLARQWLANHPHIWFEATEACTDFVGLASALASVLEPGLTDARSAVSQRARLTTNARQDVMVLAELQAKAIEPWPSGMWLAIDDYELLARSDLSEEYIDLLRRNADLRLLLTSRVRPRWVRAKDILYQDICEIGVRDLAMQEDETREVLSRRSQRAYDISAFDGWPAVVGLASLSDVPGPSPDFSRSLFQFFAEELFQRSSPVLQSVLPQLSLAPWPDPELAGHLVGRRKAPQILEEATDLGFFSPTANRLKFHPLLRQFLLTKLGETHAVRDASVETVLDYLVDRNEWDAAFEVVTYSKQPEHLVRLCDRAYSEMLALGRSETLVSWLAAAVELSAKSEVFCLMQAELALRNGDRAHARRLAERVTFSAEKEFHSRAFQVSGRAAHLGEDDAEAVRCFEMAVLTARTSRDRRDALGRLALMAQSRESLDDVTQTLSDFLEYEARTADDVLRAANVRFANAITVGGLQEVLGFGVDAAVALEHAREPAVRTSFLNVFSRCLSLQCRYEEAYSIALRLLREAESACLDFVLPHAHVGLAVAQVGLRRYVDAEAELDVAMETAEKVDDLHNLIEARNVRAKAAIARRRYENAFALTEEDDITRRVTRVMRAELTATRGLAEACSGAVRDSLVTLARAQRETSVPEVSAIVSAAQAVVEFINGGFKRAIAEITKGVELGVLDSIVIACRAHPDLGREVARQVGMPARLVSNLQPDISNTRAEGGGDEALTPREKEVLTLISRGRTNAEIASELVIAEVTAKAHVRNIIRKLGVRSRTEAAIAVLQGKSRLS